MNTFFGGNLGTYTKDKNSLIPCICAIGQKATVLQAVWIQAMGKWEKRTRIRRMFLSLGTLTIVLAVCHTVCPVEKE